MKIQFVQNGNPNLGSNRIFVYDLSKELKKFGHEVALDNYVLSGFDIYIFCKNSHVDIYNKQLFKKNVIIGKIQPNDLKEDSRNKLKNYDFFITGSIEERDYYFKYNKNIFIFPLIENIIPQKKNHKNKKIINIGYHGNLEHLEEMKGPCSRALDRLSKKYEISLKVIYDFSLGKWKVGRPRNLKIIEHNWNNLNEMISLLDDVDIGIVPCTNYFILDHKLPQGNLISKVIRKIFGGKNRRYNDYIIRFKNTSNAGRSYVFHQLGIPVVAGFWPSHFQIMGDENYGLLAHSEEGWYNSLEKLIKSSSSRQKIANNAQNLFLSLYKRKNFAKVIEEGISELLKNKK